jgi:hypothetical protein
MTSKQRLVCAILVGTLETLAAGAWAGNVEKAEALIKKGVSLRMNGKDAEALPLFEQAHDLAPTPRTTAQLGLVEQALGHWLDAESHLQQALEARRDPWLEKNRKVLTQSLVAIQEHIAWVTVSGEPAGADVVINGQKVGRLPLAKPVPIGQGSIEVELSADSYVASRRTLTVVGAQSYQLFIKLEKQAAAPPAAIATAPSISTTPAAAPTEASSPGRALRISGIALGAVALVAIANGVRLSLRVHDLNSSVHQSDANGVAEGKAASRDQRISYGVGAGALVGGGILYYLGVSAAETKQVSLAITPLRGGALGAAAVSF